jgi:hypothetical protein
MPIRRSDAAPAKPYWALGVFDRIAVVRCAVQCVVCEPHRCHLVESASSFRAGLA